MVTITVTVTDTDGAAASASTSAAISASTGMVYPYPNALNTGVPNYPNTSKGANAAAAAALPVYSGPTKITANGTVISGKTITSPLTIAANNVTIEDCYIPISGNAITFSYVQPIVASFSGEVMTVTSTAGALLPGMQLDPNGPSVLNFIPFGTSIVSQLTGPAGGAGTYQLSNAVPTGSLPTSAGLTAWPSGTLITKCEFVDAGAVSNSDKAISLAAYCTITYNNIHGYFRDIDISGSGVTAQYNYLWDMGTGGHIDVINCNGCGTNFNFSNNTIIDEQDQTTCLFVSVNFGPVNNVTINSNFMIGGDYTLYAAPWFPSGGPNVSNIFASNNAIGSGAVMGGYGYISVGASSQPFNTWSNNYDWLTGQLLPNLSNTPQANPNIVITSFASKGNTPATEPCFTLDNPAFLQFAATADVITLYGCTAGANLVDIYDESTLLGTTTAAATGIWTYLTGTLAAGIHVFTAKDTKTGLTSPSFYVDIP